MCCVVKGTDKLPQASLIRALSLFSRAELSGPNHLLEALLPNSSTLVVRFQCRNFGGTNVHSPQADHRALASRLPCAQVPHSGSGEEESRALLGTRPVRRNQSEVCSLQPSASAHSESVH